MNVCDKPAAARFKGISAQVHNKSLSDCPCCCHQPASPHKLETSRISHAVMKDQKRYKNLQEFYPYYKIEHSKTGTRVLHLVGTSLFIAQVAAAAYKRDPRLIFSGIVSAYACAWIGHFFIERNKPATFKYPFLSLVR